MNDTNRQYEISIDKLSRYKKPEVLYGLGTFKPNRRKQLLGLKAKYEKKDITDKGARIAENQFWYKTRKIVRGSIWDLALFIDTGKDVDQSINVETLKPFVDALLRFPLLDECKPNREKAKIAQMLIENSFAYLRAKTNRNVSHSEYQSIDIALNLASTLAQDFKGE